MIFPRLIEQPALGNPVKIDQGGDAVDDFLYYGDLAQARDYAGRAVALSPTADRYKLLAEIAQAQGK